MISKGEVERFPDTNLETKLVGSGDDRRVRSIEPVAPLEV